MAANDATATAATPATGARTLLLVDDDRFMLGVLNDMLIGQPYRVLSACSGEEALQVLSHEPVEVILCDQAMPGMRGTEVLAEAAARYPNTVRLMLSGQPDLTGADHGDSGDHSGNDGDSGQPQSVRHFFQIRRHRAPPSQSTRLMTMVV